MSEKTINIGGDNGNSVTLNKKKFNEIAYGTHKQMYMNEYGKWETIYDRPVQKMIFYTIPKYVERKFKQFTNYISEKWYHLMYKLMTYRLYWKDESLFNFETTEIEKAYFNMNDEKFHKLLNTEFKEDENGKLQIDETLYTNGEAFKEYQKLAMEGMNCLTDESTMNDEELAAFQYKGDWHEGHEVAVVKVDTTGQKVSSNNEVE